ncbi:MAG: flagellin [Defluviitaleaceae bacterium]|nr:flagellin [Defluviitaleaceae bacterium]
MIVNVRTNMMSLNSYRNLRLVATRQNRASQRLSSGFRINTAADDAAGLSISEKMRAQIKGLDQAAQNAQDANSLIQTAEGAMSTINEMVVRIRELVVQAANDTNAHDATDAAAWSQSDRTRIQAEINQLLAEIDATTDRTQFNTRNLIDGTLSADRAIGRELWFQVGANVGQGMRLSIEAINVEALSQVGLSFASAVPAGFSFAELRTVDTSIAAAGQGILRENGEEISKFITAIDFALSFVTEQRAKLEDLEDIIENLNIAAENLTAAKSRIQDADMAKEMMQLTQANVLQQAALFMLAQANQAPQTVLQLLN